MILGKEGTEPARASFDHWKLDACPHHGPGLSLAADGVYHAVWFGDRAGEMAVRYGHLTSEGIPVGAVRTLPDPHAEHADIVAIGTRVTILWRSFDGKKTRLRAWTSRDKGETFELHELASTPLDNDQPHLLNAGGRAVAVWRTRSDIKVIHVQP